MEDGWQEDHTEQLPYFTVDQWSNAMYFDLGGILSRVAGSDTTVPIKVVPGKRDLTRWGRIRERFGGSKVRISGAEAYDGILHDWKKKGGAPVQMNIRVHVAVRHDESVWKEISDLEKTLEAGSE